MPEGGARTVGDLVDEGFTRLHLGCVKCARIGRFGLAGLVVRHGINKRLPDLLAELSAYCPQRANISLERCGAAFEF
jgi:hypothetical protein